MATYRFVALAMDMLTQKGEKPQVIDANEKLCQVIQKVRSNKIKLDDMNTFKRVLNAVYAKWRNDKTHVEEWLKKNINCTIIFCSNISASSII